MSAKKTAEKYNLSMKLHRKLSPVKLTLMKVIPEAQRKFDPKWVDHLWSIFDLDKCRTPHVNHVAGEFHIMDGQHTVELIKRYLGDWKDQMLDCWVYENMTVEEEADMYLALNHFKNAPALRRFQVALTAEHQPETNINAIAEKNGLHITAERVEGSIQAVGALTYVYMRCNPDALDKTLQIIKHSWGDPGLNSNLIKGLGVLCHRYNGTMNPQTMINALSHINGGVNGILFPAETLRLKTGYAKYSCIAGSMVDAYNKIVGKAKRIPSWWKDQTKG